MLLEQSHLTFMDRRRLRGLIDVTEARLVALDLPTSSVLTAPSDETTARMIASVNAMMLDVLAAMARIDHEDQPRRQVEPLPRRTRRAL